MSDSRDWVPLTPPAADDHARTYVDADGRSWFVSEQPFSQYDRRSGTSLIFVSELAVRRVRSYPVDWYTLTDLALSELSWRT